MTPTRIFEIATISLNVLLLGIFLVWRFFGPGKPHLVPKTEGDAEASVSPKSPD
jgi:hypothetical protein